MGTQQSVGLSARFLDDWLQTCLEQLRGFESQLNDLNVFPIPDSDTGTNMVMTLNAGLNAVPVDEYQTMSPAHWLLQVSEGAAMQARGNSGSLLSQYLTGFAQGIAQIGGTKDRVALEARSLSTILKQADLAIGQALSDPVAGTIVDISAAAVSYAREQERLNPPLEDFLLGLYARCERALADTPKHLAVLRERGVIDAGGLGLLICLHAFVRHCGAHLSDLEVPQAAVSNGEGSHEHVGTQPIYELMFLVEQSRLDLPELRKILSAAGESVAVSQAQGYWNAHVHLNDPVEFLRRYDYSGWQNIRISDAQGHPEVGLAIAGSLDLLEHLLPVYQQIILRTPAQALTDSEVSWLKASGGRQNKVHVVSSQHERQLVAAGLGRSQVVRHSELGQILYGQNPAMSVEPVNQGSGDADLFFTELARFRDEPMLVTIAAGAEVLQRFEDEDLESLGLHAESEVCGFVLREPGADCQWLIEEN